MVEKTRKVAKSLIYYKKSAIICIYDFTRQGEIFMKKIAGEFKKFITRGNVVDMAVGVIVGGAFTGVVNGLSNFVLKPIINWLLALLMGQGSLENIVTFLGDPVYKLDADGVTQVVDMANSFYIDWGSLINAIINFLLIAVVLFTIVKVINRVKENNEKLQKEIEENRITKEDKKILKSRGIKLCQTDKVKEYLEERKAKILADQEKAKAEAEEKAKKDRLENPTVEDLLKDIRAILQQEK